MSGWVPPGDATIGTVMRQARQKLTAIYPGADLFDLPMRGSELATQTPDASRYFLGLISVTAGETRISYAVRFDARTGERWLTIES